MGVITLSAETAPSDLSGFLAGTPAEGFAPLQQPPAVFASTKPPGTASAFPPAQGAPVSDHACGVYVPVQD